MTQLGRPWRPDAQVLYRESTLNATVKTAQPWTDMSGNTWRNARFQPRQLSTARSTLIRSHAADGFAAGTTGGAGGQTVTATTYADLVRYASSSTAYTIKVDRAITVTPYGTEIKVASNKTIIGVGTAGQIVNGGFNLTDVSNVIIRNLTIRDTRMADDDPGDDGYDYDGIQVDASRNVWIDHNTILRMNDGLIDLRKDSTNITVSWNRLGENNKAFGIGWTTNVTART
ncbi:MULTISPECIES: pectate lyase family protein [Saccharothrix]|uniref:pectate lyase family protein n=1 Tax=Saccharothrix TaxID=2071 RepID=UPI00094002E3|nr:right-handed parallel beta-helix repeat-containing protein [Saccharothrix sp. CB00851]OKI16233.1 hypothetical protein A6A25_13220 [Saccharothrix sp. CB00851]